MAEQENHASRLHVAAWRGKGEGRAGSFPILSPDRDYMKACTKAFIVEFTRKYGTPDRVKAWIE